MANIKAAKKKIRQIEKRRVLNRYFAKTTRNAIKNLKDLKDKSEAEDRLKEVTAMIDKLSKKNIIHKNKAANLKSQLSKHVNSLS